MIEQVLQKLRASKQTLSVAESCTGGLLGATITAIAGSSDVFMGGFITYSNEAKHRLLGVSNSDLATYGAVSEQVAFAMAKGARARLNTDFAISITGIAGPGGATSTKAVGLVYIGLATPTKISVKRYDFGDLGREIVRQNALKEAIKLLSNQL